MKKHLSSRLLAICGLSVAVATCTLMTVLPTFATGSFGVDNFTLNIPVSCTIDGGSSTTHTQSVVNNQYYNNLGGSPTNLTMYCNDAGGYTIYARGFSNNTEGNTNLVGSTGSNIPTGVYDPNNIDTTTSSWSFKLSNTDGTVNIASGYNNFHTIPSTWTTVAKKESGTVDSTTGSHISVTYDAYISGTQAAGTYNGQVKYIMLHPSSSTQPITLAGAFNNAGKQKVQITDPLTGESGEFYRMQDMNSTICSNTNVTGAASELELVDTRDNKLYWVAKLDDGNCWMTENLDLDLETNPTKVAKLTSDNTNLKLYGSYGYDSSNGYSCSNTSATCKNGVITWTPERATSTVLSSWIYDNNNPYSYDRGLYAPNGEMDGHGYSGNYYNWPAAIASNASGYSGGNAANSVCPKGWRLPNAASVTGGYEFSKLLYAYGITKDDKNSSVYATGGFDKIIASPLYFVRAGYVNSGSLGNSAILGFYWSSAAGYGSNALDLRFYSSSINPAISYTKDYGFSVRCMAE